MPFRRFFRTANFRFFIFRCPRRRCHNSKFSTGFALPSRAASSPLFVSKRTSNSYKPFAPSEAVTRGLPFFEITAFFPPKVTKYPSRSRRETEMRLSTMLPSFTTNDLRHKPASTRPNVEIVVPAWAVCMIDFWFASTDKFSGTTDSFNVCEEQPESRAAV